MLLATIVTLVDIALAFPLAWFMARIVRAEVAHADVPRGRGAAVVEHPRADLRLAHDPGRPGRAERVPDLDAASSATPSSAFLYNETAIAITWAYVWLPFMVLPIYTALEKIPDSYLEASRDLGAGVLTTFRRVILPLALPGVVAGSIFVFSLTMGDFVAPQLVGGGSQVLGGAIKDRFGVAADFPFGAALASLTLVTLIVFLTITRRTRRAGEPVDAA